MSGFSSWRLALRVGRREARRAKWRSLLIIAMIALPVAGVVSVAVTYKTYAVDTAESLDRRLGTEAAAKVTAASAGAIRQGVDPETNVEWLSGDDGPVELDADGVRDVLGDRPMLAVNDFSLDVRTDKGVSWVKGLRTDLSDPLAAGLTRLTDGRVPRGTGEVAVNAALAARGPGLGKTLHIPHDGTDKAFRVVGIVESADLRDQPFVVGQDLPSEDTLEAPTWLVGGGSVTWTDVAGLNAKGALTLSRSVVEHPSADALAVDGDLQQASAAADPAQIVVLVLIVVMVLLEVVLLAGPAFAVAARRQARDLALISAAGGTAGQSRRVVLGMAIVLGAVAAVVGGILGIGVARLLQPLAQAQVATWFGPFEVPWLQVLMISVIGFGAAICAALVPAWIASRQNAVGVLAGRRAVSRPSRRSPVIGVVLLLAGIASSVFGTREAFSGIPIAVGLLLCVVGLLLILPALVSLSARLSAGMPLVIRFATRDADRHRTRTVPAAGAIAVTVVGVVTLGIAIGSDAAQNRASYQPEIAIGDATVTVRRGGTEGHQPGAAQWASVAEQIKKVAPGASITQTSEAMPADGAGFTEVKTVDGGEVPIEAGMWLGNLLVAGADGALPSVVTRALPGLDVEAAEKTLRSSGAVVFTSDDALVSSRTAHLAVKGYADDSGDERELHGLDVPAMFVDTGDNSAPAAAVVSPETAKRLRAAPQIAGLYVEHLRISEAAETDLDEALAAGQVSTMLHVEHGYQEPDSTVIVWLLLVTLGAVLMIGGALTATHLALNDARPDLATLAAVGARTRTRRGVAAAYALVVALLGAVPGAIIGFVPGIAITYPLTTPGWPSPEHVASHYLVIPWGLVGLVVIGLPLLIALIVAATTRSRLPLVARVD